MMDIELLKYKNKYLERCSKFSILRDKIDNIDNISKHIDVDESKCKILDIEYSIFGRIKSIKKHSNIIFIALGFSKIQLSITKKHELFNDISKLIIGDIIWVTGKTYLTSTNQFTLDINSIERISLNIFTLQNSYFQEESFSTGKKNYTIQRILFEEEKNIVLVRSHILTCMRKFLVEQGFLETHTPILQLKECTALAKQFLSFSNEEDKTIYLRIAQEIYLKRLIISGINKLFELGPNFRNEGYSPNHFTEFYTLEGYIVNKTYKDAANLIIEMINNILVVEESVMKNVCKYDYLEPKCFTLTDLFNQSTGITLNEFLAPSFDISNFCLKHKLPLHQDRLMIMLDYVENYSIPDGLVILEKLPISTTILAKSIDEYFSESCDIYLDKVEIATLFTENTDPVDQENKMRMYNPILEDEFLKDMYLGMPALAGFGIGVERLIKQLTSRKHIRDSYMFLY